VAAAKGWFVEALPRYLELFCQTVVADSADRLLISSSAAVTTLIARPQDVLI
jgi:hypothetical protein